MNEITRIYHEHHGIDGYRKMKIFLKRKNIYLSFPTVHKYMNKELKLYSIVQRKKVRYEKGKEYKTYPNLLK